MKLTERHVDRQRFGAQWILHHVAKRLWLSDGQIVEWWRERHLEAEDARVEPLRHFQDPPQIARAGGYGDVFCDGPGRVGWIAKVAIFASL